MDTWTLSAPQPHDEPVYMANGYMSAVLDSTGGIPLESLPMPCYVRGVYCDGGPGGVDRLAAVPCWSRLRYGAPAAIQAYRRDLDLRRGICRTSLTLQERRGTVEVEHEVLVSRADPHCAVLRMRLTPRFDGPIELIGGVAAMNGGDVRPLETGADGDLIWLRGLVPAHEIEIGQCLRFRHAGSGEAHADQTGVSYTVRFQARAGETAVVEQTTRLVTSLESHDPLRAAREGPHLTWDDAVAAHIAAWEALWQTRIEIEGDPVVQEFTRASLFYLWSTVREGDEWSIAPMGLSSNGYNGHIFWDAELWMYPTLLITQPEMARACVAYRERTLPAARARAAANGYRGAQFPWEGAFMGDEMTPHWAETGNFQLHITADVILGQWWYYLNTGDRAWLSRHGFPIIRECAEYWESRVEYDAERDRYTISDVVCADEYAEHVNNDAFTNAAVRAALLVATRAAELCDERATPAWREIAEKIYIPYDEPRRIHLEFDGYDGRVTKQADVELLAYPLEHTTDREQVRRDLDVYGRVIDPDGPAMSFSVYTVLEAQLGRPDEAYRYLLRAFQPNTRRPFWNFSETPTNNEFYFCTGAGGALQALLFGYAGIRLREDHFVLGPSLPSHWRALRLKGLFLAGRRTDLEIEPGCLIVRRHCSEVRPTVLEIRHGDGRLTVRAEGAQRLDLCSAGGEVLSSDTGAEMQIRPVPESGVRLRAWHRGEKVADFLLRVPTMRLP